jgi:peptidoglycan hydrolase CwlO-like protein
MRNLTAILFIMTVSVILSGFTSCGPSREEIREEMRKEVTVEVLKEIKVDQADFADYKMKKEKLNNLDVEPKEGESKLEALIRERQETKGEIAKTKQEISAKEKLIEDGEGKVKALDAAIKQAENDRLKFWANLVGGISAALAIILGIASFLSSGYPILPKVLRYTSLGFAALSVLAFGFAAIVAYLTIIGISLGVIILVAGLFFWFKDRKSLTQVVNTVENVKHEIPNYKDKFNKLIDSDVDEYVNKVRENIKKKIK